MLSVRSVGRPLILLQWSKIISLDQDNLEKIKPYDLATDLKLASTVPSVPTGRRNKHWSPVFSSAHFLQEHKDISLKEYQLKSKELKSYGI